MEYLRLCRIVKIRKRDDRILLTLSTDDGKQPNIDHELSLPLPDYQWVTGLERNGAILSDGLNVRPSA